jgi:uncharacterized protein
MRGSIMKPATLSLDAVLDEPLRFAETLSVPVSALDREPLLSITPLELSGEVSRIDGGYALSGQLVYGGELECSRCLSPYPFREDEAFSLLIYPRRPATGDEIELVPDELDALFYDEPVIALLPFAEERVQIALPMKPLCRQDCKGLCAECGKDLNLEPCGCAHELVDPRWEALKALKEKV